VQKGTRWSKFFKKVLHAAVISGTLIAPTPVAPDPCYGGSGVVQMTVISNKKASEARQSPWLGFVKFLLLAALVSLMFLLAQSMVDHRFFRGGWVDQRDVLKP
jgi:ABC-type transport system involved in cytochrome c biogenesis permease subunit